MNNALHYQLEKKNYKKNATRFFVYYYKTLIVVFVAFSICLIVECLSLSSFYEFQFDFHLHLTVFATIAVFIGLTVLYCKCLKRIKQLFKTPENTFSDTARYEIVEQENEITINNLTAQKSSVIKKNCFLKLDKLKTINVLVTINPMLFVILPKNEMLENFFAQFIPNQSSAKKEDNKSEN